MKKLIITLSIVAALGLGANAQIQNNTQNDGFFSSSMPSDGYRATTGSEELPLLPIRNSTANQDAPIGGGLLLLAGMGVAYALRRKNNN